MSFIPAMQYLAGLPVFGFIYWILDNIVTELDATGVGLTGDTYTFLLFLWTAILIVYLIFGGWWVVRKYNEQEYIGGR